MDQAMKNSEEPVTSTTTGDPTTKSGTHALVTVISLYSPTVHPHSHSDSFRKQNCCFCRIISPLLKLASVIGVNVSTTNHGSKTPQVIERDEQIRVYACSSQTARVCSLASIANAIFFLLYFYFTIWLYQHLGEHLGLFFRGVDYYTMAVDLVANFAQATFLLLYARAKAKYLSEALHQIGSIYEDLNFGASRRKSKLKYALAKKLRLLSIGLMIFVLTTTIIYGSFFVYLIFVKSLHVIPKEKRHDMITASFVLEKIGHFIIPLYSQTVSALFIVFAQVIRQLFIQLAEDLQIILGSHSATVSSHYTNYNKHELRRRPSTATVAGEEWQRGKLRHCQVEACRLLYYRLHKTVETVSNYFGGSVLVICCTSVLSITASIYVLILKKVRENGDGKEDEQGILHHYFLIWFFHLVFNIFNLGGILLSGQCVSYASQLVSKAIQDATLESIDKDTQFQITLLSQKVYGDPVQITACSITKISMTFLASACGNIITYILVLLQFRWSGSSGSAYEDNNHLVSQNITYAY